MATQRERSRAFHVETRRDSGNKKAPATHLQQRTLTTFDKLKKGGRQQEAILAQAYGLCKRLKIISGGSTASMQAMSIELFRRYTEKIKCSGVRKEMIWGDFTVIASELRLFDSFKVKLLRSIKMSVEVEDLMVIFEQYGVRQDCARVLRKTYPHLFHAERQIAKCFALEVEAAIELCGEMTRYKNGYAQDFEKTLRALYTWALSEHCHPAALDETTESTQSMMESAYDAIQVRIDKKSLCLLPLEPLELLQSQAAAALEHARVNLDLTLDSEQEEHPTLEQQEFDDKDSELHIATVECSEQRLMRESIQRLSDQQAKLKVKQEHADRIGMTSPLTLPSDPEKNILSIKEKCFGEPILYHRLAALVQSEGARAAIRPWFKAVLDGRQILRMFIKNNKKSDQALLSVKALDSGTRVHSRKSNFGVGCCDHGENGADDMMEEFVGIIGKHAKDGCVLIEPVLSEDAAAEPLLVEGIEVKPRWTIVPDGAQEYKCSAEPCGPAAKRCCALCYTLRDDHAKRHSIGRAFTLYTIRDGDTLDAIFNAHDMDYDLGCVYNPDSSTEEGQNAEEAWAELTVRDVHNSSDDFRDSCTKPLLDWHPNLDPSKRDPFKAFKVFPRDRPVQIRVRLVWDSPRPLKKMWIDAGFTWDDFSFCGTHCDMRMVEWPLFNLVRFSNRSEQEVNAWFAQYGCKMEFKIANTRWQKTSFNGQDHVEKWFEDIEYCGEEMPRWRAAVMYFDPDVDDSTAPDPSTCAVWETLIPLRQLYLCLYPTPEQQGSMGALTLQHFVAFRLRYKSKDVHHYLHKLFGHGCRAMRNFKTIGLLRNESEEALNSEDKCYIQNHSRKGGCGSDMCYDVIKRHRRKIYRVIRQAFNLKREGNKIIKW
jgi:hypothetical protein